MFYFLNFEKILLNSQKKKHIIIVFENNSKYVSMIWIEHQCLKNNKCKISNIILPKAVYIIWNIESCFVCKHVLNFCEEKSESCNGMFGLAGKTGCCFKSYWPGQWGWNLASLGESLMGLTWLSARKSRPVVLRPRCTKHTGSLG